MSVTLGMPTPLPIHSSDTIAAIATATGRAGIGIVRISGPHVPAMLHGLLNTQPLPRLAVHSDFLDEDGAIIDNGLALYFPAPASFTGEHVLELQGHGGIIVLQRLLKRCLALGARLAYPGEFTRRAVLNGKLDLVQAESIVDLINAHSEIAAKNAIRSLKGDFSAKIDQLVNTITTLRASVEATLDFSEEEIDEFSHAQRHDQIAALQQALTKLLSQAKQGMMLRDGLHVVLVGEPNVGKSSLMNALVDDDIAIVSDEVGTTRDSLREEIIIDGILLHIVDTAGLRETDQKLEKAGIERTWKAIQEADLALIIKDRHNPSDTTVQSMLKHMPLTLRHLTIYNKIDLTGEEPAVIKRDQATTILLSAKHNQGIDLLRHQILQSIGWEGCHEGLFLARERHLEALREASHYLAEALTLNHEVELTAETLRLAQQALNRITKEITTEDLLDQIFSTFCIGK